MVKKYRNSRHSQLTKAYNTSLFVTFSKLVRYRNCPSFFCSCDLATARSFSSFTLFCSTWTQIKPKKQAHAFSKGQQFIIQVWCTRGSILPTSCGSMMCSTLGLGSSGRRTRSLSVAIPSSSMADTRSLNVIQYSCNTWGATVMIVMRSWWLLWVTSKQVLISKKATAPVFSL